LTGQAMGLLQRYAELTTRLAEACADLYGDRLISLVVFGSVGRGTPKPDSDVDLLLIAEPLPKGRMARVEEFAQVERRLGAERSPLDTPCISPVFKTPEEVARGSALFLDIVEDARILLDRNGFFAGFRERFRQRLSELGAKRIWIGSAWYWDLKPDYRPGEVFEL